VSQLVLLGPQRFRPCVRGVVDSLAPGGAPVAAVTAGWQEREGENDELQAHLGREVVDLLLYHRSDDVLVRDREFAAALRERQDLLQGTQELYRVRLGHALAAARELLLRPGAAPALVEARRAAVRAVRALDREHLRRLHRLHASFEARWRPGTRPAVARQREQIATLLERCGAVLIAGGHVAVLLNRLRLFGLPDLVGPRPVAAWSAGAMAVSERVVLFHDSPPQGPGDTEVLDAGLGLCRGVVPLPHAARRLRLEDRMRVALFAQRFHPATCALLDDTARLQWNGVRLWAEPGTRRLGRDGRVREIH
jgi:hypothetical protein